LRLAVQDDGASDRIGRSHRLQLALFWCGVNGGAARKIPPQGGVVMALKPADAALAALCCG
jgi:hypothetical protein